jgi:hypothetical protein
LYNRPEVTAVPSGLSLTPLIIKKKTDLMRKIEFPGPTIWISLLFVCGFIDLLIHLFVMEQVGSSGNGFVFWRYPVGIFAGTQTVVAESFGSSPQSLQTNAGIIIL